MVAGTSYVLDEVLSIFVERGLAAQYRIAKLLLSESPKLFDIEIYLKFIVDGVAEECVPNETFAYIGRWGYTDSEGETTIPPIYDLGFDYSEHVAAVRLGDCWFYIDEQGSMVFNCAEYQGVKPARNGMYRMRKHNGEWVEQPMNARRKK